MKKTILLLCALAVLCFSSCIKEDVNGKGSNANLVKVCFHATNDLADNVPETKIGLNDNATKYVWKEGDKVGIYDTGTTSFKEFSVSKVYPDGSADIEGFMTESNTAPYYAIYPYNADAKLSDATNGKKIISAEFKRDQTATAGSIPPESIFVATSNDINLTFKTVASYVCFTVKSDNIKSVTLEDNAETALSAPTIQVYADGSGTTSANEGFYFVSLSGDFVNGKTYYLAVKEGSFKSGLTLSIKDSDGNVYYRTSAKAPGNPAGRNQLLNLKDIEIGKMTKLTEEDEHYNDRKWKWIHGVDFEMGNITINKYTHPYPFRTNAIKNGFVSFIDNDIDMTSPANAIIMSRYEDKKVKLKKEGSPIYFSATNNEDFVVLSNVELSVTSTSGYFITNNKDGMILEQVVLDRISVTLPNGKHLIATTTDNAKTALRPIKNVTISNSDICIEENSKNAAILNIATPNSETIEDFSFINNKIYCAKTDLNVDPSATYNYFNILASYADVTFKHVALNRNTIVNLYPKGNFVNAQSLVEGAKGEFTHNLFYFDNVKYLRSYQSIPAICGKPFNKDNSDFNNNYVVFGDNDELIPPADNLLIRLASNTTSVDGAITHKLSKEQDVFDMDQFDIANGLFVYDSTTYGAQR